MALKLTCPDVSDHPDFDNHETVLRAEDKEIGFLAFLAVHNTMSGPARGGCRYWPHYRNENQALGDALRLSRGMTFKTTMADLPFGGGKTVIFGKPGTKNPTPEIMHALGHALNELGGIYETGEDVGTRTSDFKTAGEVTEWVRPRSIEKAGAQDLPGGPPYYTAHGVFAAMKAGVQYKLKTDSFKDIRIAIKGLGNVAMPLCGFLHDAGAVLTVADIDAQKAKYAEDKFGAHIVSPDKIMFQDVDIYSPCALGGDLNEENIERLKASMVIGAANNQLASPHCADLLHQGGIAYAPDYAANAGGVINVVLVGYTHEEVLARVYGIEKTLQQVFKRSEAENLSTADIADKIVEEKLQNLASEAIEKQKIRG